MRSVSLIIISMLGLCAMAQKLTFHSSEFEMGVKSHIGLNADDDVIQNQADTITSIDLSGLGITDIRDVVYLPNVKVLNLSNNGITDTFPLTVLDSLRLVNLCNNELESINPLVFSNSDKMQLHIAYNYISDFSYFLTPAKCQISIVGMAQQQEKNAPYFDVYQLYADIDEKEASMVCYRGYTNMEADVTLKCGSLQVQALMDGTTYNVVLSDEFDATTQVILSNGEQGDTTWVVPPTTRIMESGGEVTIETELPESYRIGFLRALHGTVEANGTTLHYLAPSPLEADTLYLSYYEDNCIKGFTQMYFMSQDFIDKVKAPLQNSPLKVSLHDGVLNIAGMPTQGKGITDIKVYDVLGRMLATRTSDSLQSMDIPLSTESSVVIVEVTYSGQHIVTKVVAK